MFSRNVENKIGNNKTQEKFLNFITKNEWPMTVYLCNGIRLQGKITDFDNNSVLLDKSGKSQLVYKNAIATLFPEDNGDKIIDFS